MVYSSNPNLYPYLDIKSLPYDGLIYDILQLFFIYSKNFLHPFVTYFNFKLNISAISFVERVAFSKLAPKNTQAAIIYFLLIPLIIIFLSLFLPL